MSSFMLGRIPLALATILTTSTWAQSVISAHSGVIQYQDGQVEVDSQPIHQKPQNGQFVEVKPGQTLTVRDGRAEILLTPGVFLRVAENSSLRMISNKLADTRIEVLSGSVMAEVGELLHDNAITLVFHGADISLLRRGLYRIDSDLTRLRVYDGEAHVSGSSREAVTVRKSRAIVFGEQLEVKHFDTKQTDAFYDWCARRDQYVAEANVYAAKSARDAGMGYGSGYNSGNGNGLGSWAYNPLFGMFTYMPYSGTFYSPFGLGYYSPDGASSAVARSGGSAGSSVGGIGMRSGISGGGRGAAAGGAGGSGGHR
jgi:hypothetical protein